MFRQLSAFIFLLHPFRAPLSAPDRRPRRKSDESRDSASVF